MKVSCEIFEKWKGLIRVLRTLDIDATLKLRHGSFYEFLRHQTDNLRSFGQSIGGNFIIKSDSTCQITFVSVIMINIYILLSYGSNVGRLPIYGLTFLAITMVIFLAYLEKVTQIIKVRKIASYLGFSCLIDRFIIVFWCSVENFMIDWKPHVVLPLLWAKK